MHEIEQQPEILPARKLSPAEIEVRLAIADCFIRSTAGTPEARGIFEALVSRFNGKYPHHKLLTQMLINPEYLQPQTEVITQPGE